MDEDNEPVDPPYEADPLDSDDEDEFPEFGNDENKKLFELVHNHPHRFVRKSATSKKSIRNMTRISSVKKSWKNTSRMSTKNC